MILKFCWPLLLLAAGILEVYGDATVRKGLRASRISYIILGFLVLGCYGLVVNVIRWDFGKLLGVYVAIFALISVLWGRFVLHERITISTKVGVAVIILGGIIISWSEIVILFRGLAMVLLRDEVQL